MAKNFLPPWKNFINTDLLTPTFPNVLVRGSSGRMQALSFLCSGFLIQSSQYDFGHFVLNSVHRERVNIHPRPGKKSVLYKSSGWVSSTSPDLPLSFQAETHQRVGSRFNSQYVPRKYSKKSEAISKSSEKKKKLLN